MATQGRRPIMNPAEIQQFLRNSEFLKGLTPADIEKISSICRPVNFEAGDYVFHQGDFGEHLYIIVSGYIFLERAMDIGKHKGNVVIDALGRGRTLGCWSSLLGQPHVMMSSASCQKPTTILTFNGTDLRGMMLENSHFGFNILERLCFLLRDRIQAAYGAMDKI
jgi:CRP/FNR family cyclic AMP-dependent transcriptional regulator